MYGLSLRSCVCVSVGNERELACNETTGEPIGMPFECGLGWTQCVGPEFPVLPTRRGSVAHHIPGQAPTCLRSIFSILSTLFTHGAAAMRPLATSTAGAYYSGGTNCRSRMEHK